MYGISFTCLHCGHPVGKTGQIGVDSACSLEISIPTGWASYSGGIRGPADVSYHVGTC